MKLKINKKILFIVLLFLFFIVLDNKCFAAHSVMTMSAANNILSTCNINSYIGVNDFLNYNDIKNVIIEKHGNYTYVIFLTSNSYISCSGGTYTITNTNYIQIKTSSNTVTSVVNTLSNKTIHTTGSYPLQSYFSTIYFKYDNSYYFNDLGDFINGTFYENGYTPTPPIVYETPTLYIDDMNLRKRFSWQFQIPMVRDDTKYYVFLEDYNRISYSSVRATFRIFTVTTPEDYDYTDYENYMYYDNLEKKLYLPAGCEIKEYSCTGTNGDLYSLTLEDEFTAERDNKIFYDSETLRENIFLGLGNSFSQFNNSSLFPTNTLFFDYNPREVAFNLLSPLATLYNKTIAKLLPFIRF